MSYIQTFLDLFFPPRESEQRIRHQRRDALLPLLSPTLRTKTTPATITLLPFTTPMVRAAIHEAKYAKNNKAYNMLSCVLEDYLHEWCSEKHNIYLLPIPLSETRLRERGYNQCQKILEYLTIPVPTAPQNTLIRIKDTKRQTDLGRDERNINMRGAFSAANIVSDATYVLIDDVLTTGATMQAAINALHKAGAQQIFPIAIAH